MSYEAELAFATDLAHEAGEIMLRHFGADDLGTEWKADDTPLTVADTAINKLFIEWVKSVFPEHGVLGEEESFEPERDYVWAVDPIDGTVMFDLGMPLSTFSAALVERKDGQPLVAVTYDPYLKELYSATIGGGAFMNDEPITVSRATELRHGVVAVTGRNVQEQGVDFRPGKINEQLRAQGARSINLASFVYTSNRIARGQLLGSVIGSAGAWDIAASGLIVEEAGGVVTDLKGNKRRFDEDGLGCIMAANKTIHAMILGMINEQP
jgi:fructose-1,6-bisphosphatase/inositol monophosphatase family enzyme